jgi:hypothetical protein
VPTTSAGIFPLSEVVCHARRHRARLTALCKSQWKCRIK